MAVAPGTRLGPYEISSPIGSGGMGEVYRARDTRLDRHVAIKILPAEFAADAQLRLRLEREAKNLGTQSPEHVHAVRRRRGYGRLEQTAKTDWDLWLYSLDDHRARIFLQTPFTETNGRFSPDGRWVVYQSNESGKTQIYVLPVSGNLGKWQISTDGGTRARWSRDGKTIYYITPDYKLMAVDVATRGDEFTAGTPRTLFSINAKRLNGAQYDLSPDGKRFIVNSNMEHGEVAPLTLVQNWTASLKK